jgi:hypothetical protein
MWKDDLVNVSEPSCDVRIGKFISVVFRELISLLLVLCGLNLLSEDDVDCSVSTNYCDFRIEAEFISHRLLILKATSQQYVNRILLKDVYLILQQIAPVFLITHPDHQVSYSRLLYIERAFYLLA